MSHNCKAIIFTCIDWRLHPRLEELLKERYGAFDLCVTAGAIKGLGDPVARDFLLSQIEISKKLHNSEIVILIMHRDCGAYGGSGAFADKEAEIVHHSKILEETSGFIRKKFPNIKIEKFFVDLEEKDGEWQCDFLPTLAVLRTSS